MKKACIVTFTFSLLSLTLTASPAIDSLSARIAILEKKSTAYIQQTKDADERFKRAQETIDRQSDLISGFGTVYSILSILVAAVAIGIPLVNRYEIQRFKKTVDKRVSKYIEQSRKNSLRDAITKISDHHAPVADNAALYVKNEHRQQLTDEQLRTLVDAFMKSTNSFVKETIIEILSGYRTRDINILMNSIIAGGIMDYVEQAFSYMAVNGFEDHIKSLVAMLNTHKEWQVSMVPLLFNTFYGKGNSKVVPLLNSPEWMLFDPLYNMLAICDNTLNGMGLKVAYDNSVLKAAIIKKFPPHAAS